MACHICKRTGVRTCDPYEADIKCLICGFCNKENIRIKNLKNGEDFENAKNNAL